MKVEVNKKLKQTGPKLRQWLLFASVLVICTIVTIFGDEARRVLRYESDLLVQHEYWRLISAHFVHLGWSHFALNMLGFLALWSIYGGLFSVKSWLMILSISTLGISFCFLQFDSSLIWYVGLSGILHSLFAVLLVYLLLQRVLLKKNYFKWEDALLLVFLVFKLFYEQIVGAVPLTEIGSGGPVVVNAHLYGAIIGCILAVFLFKFTNSNVSN